MDATTNRRGRLGLLLLLLLLAGTHRSDVGRHRVGRARGDLREGGGHGREQRHVVGRRLHQSAVGPRGGFLRRACLGRGRHVLARRLPGRHLHLEERRGRVRWLPGGGGRLGRPRPRRQRHHAQRRRQRDRRCCRVISRRHGARRYGRHRRPRRLHRQGCEHLLQRQHQGRRPAGLRQSHSGEPGRQDQLLLPVRCRHVHPGRRPDTHPHHLQRQCRDVVWRCPGDPQRQPHDERHHLPQQQGQFGLVRRRRHARRRRAHHPDRRPLCEQQCPERRRDRAHLLRAGRRRTGRRRDILPRHDSCVDQRRLGGQHGAPGWRRRRNERRRRQRDPDQRRLRREQRDRGSRPSPRIKRQPRPQQRDGHRDELDPLGQHGLRHSAAVRRHGREPHRHRQRRAGRLDRDGQHRRLPVRQLGRSESPGGHRLGRPRQRVRHRRRRLSSRRRFACRRRRRQHGSTVRPGRRPARRPPHPGRRR